ncbi:trophoblast glycoprotein-like [Ambystoma mexicanum]|uniref:trophoblast glycoprotein-like n=1 Tax=Ambystoma mexicanum TaxID=8296 RepID=UPI0037E84BB1
MPLPFRGPWLLFGALLSSWPPPSLAACPVPCECSEAARTVKCVGKDLSRIPSGLPGYTRNLFITGNHIPNLGTADLRGLPHLVTLGLSANRINMVEYQAFASLPNLRFLDLSNNLLAYVHPDAFNPVNNSIQELGLSRALYNSSAIQHVATSLSRGGFRHLSKLELADNAIVYLPPGMFVGMSNLRQLDLRNNSLVDIKNGTFADLRLDSIDLSLNALKTLRTGALGDLGVQASLHLYLKENPFVCNCDIEELAAWLNVSTQVQDTEQLVCAFPEDLRNVSLVALAETELDCHAVEDVLHPSYVFLGVVLGIVGMVFLFVLYLNRKGMKTWIISMRDGCHDLMEGYHYRYEIDSDPRVTRVSTTSDI